MTASRDKEIADAVERTARLAELRFPPGEFPRFIEKASAVVAFVEQLSAVDTSGVEPTSHAAAAKLPLRPDVPASSGEAQAILAAAPGRSGAFIQVPRVLDGD